MNKRRFPVKLPNRIVLHPRRRAGVDMWHYLLPDGDDAPLEGIWLCGEARSTDWCRLSVDDAKSELIPIISEQLVEEAYLKFMDFPLNPSPALITMIELLLKSVMTKTFNSIILNYTTAVSEEFVRAHSASSALVELHLEGSWPNGAREHVKSFLSSPHAADPHLALGRSNRMSIDRELVDLIFGKFVHGADILVCNVAGKPEFDLDYLRTLRPDLRCTEFGDHATFHWKSPVDALEGHRFKVQFQDDGCVRISVFCMGNCDFQAKKTTPLPVDNDDDL